MTRKGHFSNFSDNNYAGPPPTKKTKVSTAGGDAVDFSKMKVAELKEECEKRGLESSGKKAELVSRLQAATTTGTR